MLGGDGLPSMLIRADALDRFAKVLPGGTAVDLSVDTGSDGAASLAGFTAGGLSLSVRLLSGEFPDASARKLLDMPVSATAVMDSAAVAEAVARAEVVMMPSGGVLVTFTSGEATVTGSDGEGAREEETFPCEFDGDGPVTIRVNPKFLRAAVEAVRDERVAVEFTSGGSARIVVRAHVPPAAHRSDVLAYRHVLMPIKAGDSR
jgi:DNA polymerase III sliding clamp (beta) subunit (PCNA family)